MRLSVRRPAGNTGGSESREVVSDRCEEDTVTVGAADTVLSLAAWPSKAREVLESPPDGKRRVYTSILSVMQEMEKRGQPAHDVEKNTYIYRPTVTKKQVLGPWLRSVVKTIFGGSSAEMAAQLL